MKVVEPVEEVRAHIDAFYDGNQSGFARATGFSPTYVSDVLSGRRAASEKMLAVLGLKRAVVKLEAHRPPLRVKDAELSVRTMVTAMRVWGEDMLLRDLTAKSDDDLKAAGMMRRSIKEIREIGAWL